jgi:hypothetical protein
MSKIKEELKKLELENINDKVDSSISRIEEVDNIIAEFKKEAVDISIKDSDDKKGYEATVKFLGKIRPQRTELEAERKTVVKPFNAFVKVINDAYYSPIEEIEKLEAPKKEAKKNYDDFHEKRKADEFAAKEKAIDDKVRLAVDAGLELDIQTMYYKNDMGITVTRLDIQNMQDADFENLITRAKIRKEEKLQDELILKQAEEKKKARVNKLLLIGASPLNNYYVIFDNVTNSNAELLQKEVEQCTDEEFEAKFQYFKSIKDGNNKYQAEAKQKREQDLKDAEYLKQKQNDLKRQQITVWQQMMSALGGGYVYVYGAGVEDSWFTFKNLHGGVKQIVGDCFLNNALVESFIADANKLIQLQNDANKKVEEEKQKKEEKDVADLVEAENAAKKKAVENKKIYAADIENIDKGLSVIEKQLFVFNNYDYKMLTGNVDALVQKLNAEIDAFKNSLNHLR